MADKQYTKVVLKAVARNECSIFIYDDLQGGRNSDYNRYSDMTASGSPEADNHRESHERLWSVPFNKCATKNKILAKLKSLSISSLHSTQYSWSFDMRHYNEIIKMISNIAKYQPKTDLPQTFNKRAVSAIIMCGHKVVHISL